VRGLVLATEWLDNVPLDIAAPDEHGTLRYLLVDPTSGAETLGEPLTPNDQAWTRQWWPLSTGDSPQRRVELGSPRDAAWQLAVSTVVAGLLVTVDYGHTRDARPVDATVTGYAGGRAVAPVPDGSVDITAHVAVDAVAAAGAAVAGEEPVVLSQRAALAALGLDGNRPPLALAATDPTGYLRALSDASQIAELTDPHGLGGHFWVAQPVGIDAPTALRRARTPAPPYDRSP
jgi:SAM-dependent MidA family methyltransferase